MATAAQAQLGVTVDTDGVNLANALVGTGTDIQNVQLVCGSQSSGFFSGGGTTNLGIGSGVVLSTGIITDIPQPAAIFANGYVGTPGDVELNTFSGMTTYDACVLEFDVTVAGDTLMMDYVFASEEYPEFQCTSFNDVFAFQLTGPKPGGGTYDNYNIARIPGSELSVSVNNVNGNTEINAFCPVDNSAYYVDNETGTDIVYDGFTVPLTAKAATIPGETYHMRFAVADATDLMWDTGVFLVTGALRSTGATRVTAINMQLGTLAPNPTTGVTLLKNETRQPVAYVITNLMGQELLQGTLEAGTVVQIDLSSFSAGVYLARMNNGADVTVQRLQVVR